MKLWESKCNLLNVLVYSVIVLVEQGSDIWRNKEKESVQQTPTHSLAHLLSNTCKHCCYVEKCSVHFKYQIHPNTA